VPQTCLVNLFELDPPRNGGASRIALEVTRLLLDHARRGELSVLVAVGRRFASKFAAWVGDADAPVLPCLDNPAPVFRALRPDLIVSPLFGPSPIHHVDGFRSIPHVVSVPDVYALDRPDALPPPEAQRRRAFYAALAHASRVVTISESSRQRLLHHLPLDPALVCVVPPGVDPRPASSATPLVQGRFVLYPARDWAHKRHAFLLEVMDEVWRASPDLTLVLTGWHDSSPAAPLPTKNRRGQVVDLGYVTDDELGALYARADALVYPSSFEGFGLPVLEAMAAGCPVVCSGLEVLRELTADSALVPSAESVQAWVRAIVEDLPRRRTELVAAGRARAAWFSVARMRCRWSEQLEVAGLRLSAPSFQPSLVVPVSEVRAELMLWADLAHHADERLKVIADLQRLLARRPAASPERSAHARTDAERPAPTSRLRALVRSALVALRRA
jgi:glycosyltransferase involved in cell wall biosynthesis